MGQTNSQSSWQLLKVETGNSYLKALLMLSLPKKKSPVNIKGEVAGILWTVIIFFKPYPKKKVMLI